MSGREKLADAVSIEVAEEFDDVVEHELGREPAGLRSCENDAFSTSMRTVRGNARNRTREVVRASTAVRAVLGRNRNQIWRTRDRGTTSP